MKILKGHPIPLLILYALILIFLGMMISILFLRTSVRQSAPVFEFQNNLYEKLIRKPIPSKSNSKGTRTNTLPASTAKIDKKQKNPADVCQNPNNAQKDKKPASYSLVLNGIAISPGEPSTRIAIINGKNVEIGDLVDGARVEDIQKNFVRLLFNGQKIELSLSK